jgi:ubiquinone/menaquinone biosynthesis C-methylase UbiE
VAATRPAPARLGDAWAAEAKEANLRYHDAVARSYEGKWSISFDDRCVRYVRERADRMLPRRRYDRVLDVGAGTGFFVLNLWQAGFVGRAFACDLSPGMLEACSANAGRLGCPLDARVADAEALPYADRSFDLVVGHAVLHHLPDPGAAMAEIRRVLAPGGAVLLAGEPSRLGSRIADVSRRVARAATLAAGRRWPGILARHPEPTTDGERVERALEWSVDLHTFEPEDLEEMARRAGFGAVRSGTEELASSVVGWAVRTVEYLVRPEVLGARWPWIAYRTYLGLYALDRSVLSRLVPARAFHNVLLYAERPG